ncbi:MAG: hypothetical protein JWN95_1118 [Frankiales bacterium]|nr:hypothetical protein [Frankiales bacterium]
MTSRRDLFIDLSVELTGYSRVQLLGTGMSERYLQALDEVLPDGMVDEFLATSAALPTMTIDAILRSETWGPVTRNIMILWYCGRWTALPDSWRAVHGTRPADSNHVISADSYQAGLQWVAAGAHPAGARQQGFGAWTVAPEEAAS